MHSCHLNLSNIPPFFTNRYIVHIFILRFVLERFVPFQLNNWLFTPSVHPQTISQKTFYTVYAIFHDGFKKIVLAPNWQHPSHINFMTLTGTIMTDCTDGRMLLLLVVQCRCNYLNSEFQLNFFYVKLLRLSMYIWLVL